MTVPLSSPETLIVTYQVAAPELPADKLDKMAKQIAVGQTIGTFHPAEVELLKAYQAHVVDIRPIDGADGLQYALIRVAYPAPIVSSDLGTLLAVIFGKLSMAGRVRVVDLDIPDSLGQRYQGPALGIEGIRQLTGVASGPLLMSIFKPCLGLPPETLGEMFYTQAMGGVNLVKDDEILSDPDIDSALRRLEACLRAQEKAEAEGGNKLLYAINLTGPAEDILNRARRLVNAGATAFLFNYLCYGLPMLNALRQDPKINIPLVAHPALAGAFYGSPTHGLSPNVIFGTLPRLAGADLVLFPSPYGSVALPKDDAMAVKQALTAPMASLKNTFPVPSAGIVSEMVPDMFRDFGNDVVINAGTGIHDNPAGSLAGARAFASAIREQQMAPTA